MAKVTILLAVLGCCSSTLAWHYPESPQNGWAGKCAEGMNQSPIDIQTKDVIKAAYEPLVPIYYNAPVNYNLTNNGHSIVLNAQNGCKASVTGGDLKHLYTLDNIHFHWGGSEHTVNGKRFLCEVHFVHHDTRYKNVADAMKSPSGIAVVGVLFHQSENDIPNPEIAVLLNAVRQVAHSERSVSLPNAFAPSDLLPTDTSRWWRYSGSLTTPGCNESVIWTVMEDTLPISNEQVSQFQEMFQKGEPLKENYRDVQPLNGRPVYYEHPLHDKGAAHGLRHSTKLATILPILALLPAVVTFA